MQLFFITGTDTGVGKTFASAGLFAALATEEKAMPRYIKVIETGMSSQDGDAAMIRCHVEKLLQIQFQNEQFITLRSYSLPASPHLASAHAGKPLTKDALDELQNKMLEAISDWQTCYADNASIIMEGAGGVFVPLAEDPKDKQSTVHHNETPAPVCAGFITWLEFLKTFSSLVKKKLHVEVQIILVARTGLGTLNHTLLSIHALSSHMLPLPALVCLNDGERSLSAKKIVGVTAAEQEEPELILADNHRFFKKHLGVPVMRIGDDAAALVEWAKWLL